IFRGGADVARVQESAYRVQEAQEVRNRAHRQVVESVRLAWSTFVTAKSQLRHRQIHMQASQRTQEAYYKQFNIGQRTLLDLLDSEAELFASRTNYVTSRYQELLGRFRVLNASGELLNSLSVPLPVAAAPMPKRLFDK
ncbi:MAG TPA: TolC family protein, partial [Gammaproteobacteria bacterium]|nr:TolC family protein [Gammaproteobacteria bacterium]